MKLLNAIAATAAIGTSLIAVNPGRAFLSRYKPDGYGGQACMTGSDQKQEYNYPAKASNYKKDIEDDQKQLERHAGDLMS